MEKVWGPINGFYIAAYAVPIADGQRFCSYAKVCAEPPGTYWDALCLFKLFGGEDHDSEIGALAFARLAAQAQIERIPSRDRSSLGFAVFDEAKDVIFPLHQQIRRVQQQRAAA
ncbi:hypothetical protein [Ramlibacter sp.]|uniref:hypothetical protein n=1 Tax=Ramlibacter sp. TaxID=1917967 RepID=UPI003D0B146F